MRVNRAVQRGPFRGRRLTELGADQSGGSTLEFSLILAAVVVPMYWVIMMLLRLMIGQYQMITFLNGWPFP